MTQQGESWWDKLYDESAPDTGPTASGDTLDDRFDTAARATTDPPPDTKSPTRPTGPDPRAEAPATASRSTAPDTTPDPPPAPPAPPAPPVPTAPPAPVAAPVPPAPVPPVPGRAPWEAAEAGPRTFPAPPAEALTVQVPAPPDPPDPEQEPEKGQGPERGQEPEKKREPEEEEEREQPPARTGHAPTVQVALPVPRPRTGFVGSRPPTYEPEPTALPVARPGELADVVADTVLDGARYGTCTLRAASVRGDSARFRGEPRRDALLTARFGHDEAALVLVAVAAGSRAAEDAHLAAADACRWIAEAVCRSHTRLSEDIRSGRRGDLKSGLHRLTDRTYGKLRARAAERGLAPDEYTASLRCLLLPADPECRTRVFFGVGGGGLFRLRDGAWQDIEPLLPERAAVGAPVVGFGSPPPAPSVPEATEEEDRLTMDLGITTAPGPLIEEPVPPPAEPFRFRASVARPGDTLLLASPGLTEPMRGEPGLARELADRWAGAEPPGLAAFLADTQVRVTGYADDRTGVAVWEA